MKLRTLTFVCFFLLGCGSNLFTRKAHAQDDAAPSERAIVTQPGQRQANAAKYRYWTTQWAFDDIEIGTLFNRLRRLGIDIPVDADGPVTLRFSVSIPLNALRTGQAYRFSGTLSSPRLRIEQLQLANFSANAEYDNGMLTLSGLRTDWLDLQSESTSIARSAGLLSGDATAAIVPRGDMTASVTASGLSVSPVYDLFLKLSDDASRPILQGSVGGALSMRAPLNAVRDVTRWNVDADLVADNLSIDGTLPLSIRSGPVSLRNGQVESPSIVLGSTADSRVRVSSSLSASLLDERGFDFTLLGDDVPLQSVAKLLALGGESAMTGKLDIDAKGNGRLGRGDISDATWNLAGRLASPGLTAFGMSLGLIEHQFQFDSKHLEATRIQPLRDTAVNESFVIDRIAADYSIDDESFELRDLDAAVFGGSITGSARIAREQLDSHQVNLQWQQLQPRLNTSFFLPAEVNVSMQTSGSVQWVAPADALDRPARHVGTATIEINDVLVGSESLGNAQLAMASQDGLLELSGGGNAFGGTFRVDTSSQVPTTATWWDVIPVPIPVTEVAEDIPSPNNFSTSRTNVTDSGAGPFETLPRPHDDPAVVATAWAGGLSFSGVSVARLTRVMMIRDRVWDGIVSGNIQLQTVAPETRELQVRAVLNAEHVSADRQLIARGVRADLTIDRDSLRVNSFQGNLAGGRVDVAGRIALSDARGRLQVRLSSIDASQMLTTFSSDAGDWASGLASGNLSVETGETIRAQGVVLIRNSQLLSIPAGDAHASLSASSTMDLSRWSVSIQSVESSIEQGRLLGSAVIRSSSARPGAFDLVSNWSARRVNFGALLERVGTGGSYARGNVDGNLTLGGTGIRSVNDLSGRFNAELDGTQARAIPGLISAQAYIGAFSLAGTRFSEGGLRGTIGSGSAMIQDMWLLSDRLQVFANGRVQLSNGYMDVNTIISTGNFDVANIALTSIAEQIALDAFLPLAAFIRLNRLLSDRTLYVQLQGPISDPRMRLRPLDTFRQGFRRFLVRETISTVAPFATDTGLILNNSQM